MASYDDDGSVGSGSGDSMGSDAPVSFDEQVSLLAQALQTGSDVAQCEELEVRRVCHS